MLLHIGVVDDQPHIASKETVVAGDVSQIESNVVDIQSHGENAVGISKAAVAVAFQLGIGGLERCGVS